MEEELNRVREELIKATVKQDVMDGDSLVVPGEISRRGTAKLRG